MQPTTPPQSPQQHAVRLLYASADLKTNAAWAAVTDALAREQAAPPRRAGAAAEGDGDGGFDLVFSDAWHAPAALHWESH